MKVIRKHLIFLNLLKSCSSVPLDQKLLLLDCKAIYSFSVFWIGNNFWSRGTELQLLSRFRFSICFPSFFRYTLHPHGVYFSPSTAIAKLKVYVIRLHRLPALMEYFVVWMTGDACSHGGLTGDTQRSPHYVLALYQVVSLWVIT